MLTSKASLQKNIPPQVKSHHFSLNFPRSVFQIPIKFFLEILTIHLKFKYAQKSTKLLQPHTSLLRVQLPKNITQKFITMKSTLLLFYYVTSHKKLLNERQVVRKRDHSIGVVVQISKMWVNHSKQHQGMKRWGKF